jgi:hypothetical protein
VGGIGVELATFDVLVELAVAVDEAEGVSHLVQECCEKVVFTGGCAVRICDVIVSQSPSHPVAWSEFTRIPWGGVDEPADSVGIVVDADGGGVGATILVVACDGGFG